MLKFQETSHKALHVCICVFSGLSNKRGDKKHIAELMVKPYILAMSVPSDGYTPSSRKKRSTATEPTCDEWVTFCRLCSTLLFFSSFSHPYLSLVHIQYFLTISLSGKKKNLPDCPHLLIVSHDLTHLFVVFLLEKQRPAACGHSSLISGRILAGSGSTSLKDTLPTTAWAPAHTSGMLKTNTHR